ncbi:MAG: transposase [Gemmataceae bacterium]
MSPTISGSKPEDSVIAKSLLPGLWEIIQPLLPVRPPRPRGGRPPVDDRKALTGILFLLKTGMAWEDLPAELGCGCGMTCWRRLRDWQRDGTWRKIHAALWGTWTRRARSTGVPPSTRRVCVQFGGRHRLQPHGPGQGRR